MDESSKKIESIILDTNIIFSSLVKEEGYTQAVISILLSQKSIDLLIPSAVKTEINTHLREISIKSRLPINIVRNILNIIFSKIKTIREEEFKEEIVKSFDFVKHKKDSPFAGLAIRHAPSIILTYNKRHFDVEKLKEVDVLVFEPKELVKYFDLEIRLKKRVRKQKGILKLLSKLYLLKRFKFKDNSFV